MTLLYIIPASFSAALVWKEWIVVGIWLALGVFFYFYSKRKYGAEFGRDILLNSSLLGWDATAQFIEELVERRFGLTEEKLEKGA